MGNIKRLTQSERNDPFLSSAFFTEMENHYPSLLRKGQYTKKLIEIGVASAFAGDFYSVAMRAGVAENLRYFSMRMTGFISPSDFTGKELDLIIPNEDAIQAIFRIWMTHNRKA